MITSRSERAAAKRKKRKRAIFRQLTSLVLILAFGIIVLVATAWLMDSLGQDERVQPASTAGKLDDATTAADDSTGAAPLEEGADEALSDESPDSLTAAGGASNDSPANDGAASPDEETVSLAFVGDVLLGSTVAGLLERHGYDYPYAHVKEQLQQADLTIANLETPITDRGEPADKEYVYRSSPSVLPAFREAGFDVVNLANNHILDYGKEGLLDTFRHLKEADIAYVGAGKNGQEAFAPAYFERNGIRIAVLGFSHVVPTTDWKARDMSEREPSGHPGVAPTYDHTRPVEVIERAGEHADLVIVLVHWGKEREELPADYQVDLARRYINAGADLIVGTHPHVLQSYEHYKGKWIAYSLGNFIFTTNQNPKTWDSSILEATCSKSGDCELRITPVLTKAAQPIVMEGQEGEALLTRIDELSERVRVDATGRLMAEK